MFKPLVPPVYAEIKEWEKVSGAIPPNQKSGFGPDAVSLKALEAVFSNILAIATTLAGLIVFVMLIKGGFGYIFSAGDPEKIKKATSTLSWAVAGLFIMLGIWFVFKLLEQFAGITLTEFTIPGP